jgi:flavin-dependent dehydrogenase
VSGSGWFDVAVAGGGPAGCAAALVLARAGRRVLLVDEPPRLKVGEGLPPAARRVLDALGVLGRVAADGHRPSYGNLSSWGSRELVPTDFVFGADGPGWQLDRVRFDASLRDAAREAGAEVREGAWIWHADRLPGRRAWEVPLGDDVVECGWMIDATGRRSALARKEGAVRTPGDAQVAFHARFRAPSEDDQDGRTLVEAAPDGWWYTALVPGGERVVAYLSDSDLAGREALEPEGFAARLAATLHVRTLLEEFGYEMDAEPRGADASGARLDRFRGEGWVAAGDAALSFDPLSSQGMLTALYSGMKAGEAVHAQLSGDASALEAYESRLEEVWAAYRENRAAHYAAEMRWAARPFWRRRHDEADGGARKAGAAR